MWRRYLRFWGPDVAADVDDELRFHLESRAEELVARGASPAAARAEAEREFGDVARVRAEVRALDEQATRRRAWGEAAAGLLADLRVALRALRAAPGFALTVVATIALGIGLNTAVFSVVAGYLLRPLPVREADRVVVLGAVDRLLAMPHELSYPDLVDYRALRDVFAGVSGYASATASLAGGDRAPERIWVDQVTPDFFTTLGVTMAHGRAMLPSDGVTAPAQEIVLSDAFWRRRFHGDPSVVGDTVRIDGRPRTVVGVAPPAFRGVNSLLAVDGWAALDGTPGTRAALARRDDRFLYAIARLAPGVSLDRARAAAHLRARQLARAYPQTDGGADVVVVPETRSRPVIAVAGTVPRIAAVFLAMAALVLLVACANVASLVLARAAAHEREQAVRAALGAGRWRLARAALVECLLLAAAGGVGALALAVVATRWLAHLRVATDTPVRFDVAPDWRAFAFTAAAVAAAALLVGVGPSLRGARADPNRALQAGGARAGGGVRLRRLRGALVAAQLAIAALVLVCAGLLARSMANAGSLDLGFRTDSLLMGSVDLSIAGRDSARAAAFFAEAERRVRALPGVRAAALAAHTPLGYFNGTLKLVPAQRTPTVPPEGLTVFANPVGTDYFRAMGQRLLAGREFSERDDAAAPPVLIVNEALARRLWPGEDPLGQRVRVGDDGRVALVVGLARTATYNFLNEAPLPFAYVPYRQHRRDAMTFFVHTAGDPDALAPALRAVVRELDPDAPLYDVRSMRDHLVNGRALLFVRLGAAIAAAFGVLALTLATVGAYGVVAYSASQRTREIGIRVAFGARAGRVARLLVGQGLALAAVGVGSGIGAAAAAGRALSALLYDVRPGDPVVFGAVAALLAAVVALASLVPAWRAARLDPTVALRSEG